MGMLTGPFEAVLFDCDGVLVDSLAICRDTWTRWMKRVGIDRCSSVAGFEARPVREAMADLIPDHRLDQEVTWFKATELQSAGGVGAAPGALEAVEGLTDADWAVVTSASRALARARLAAAGLPLPSVLVSADDVALGKPDPDCYRLAARQLGVPIERCVAIEDSTIGARAAKRAGATVVGVGAAIESSEIHVGPLADLRSVQLRAIRRNEILLDVLGD